jgi:hypothetical protein
VTAGFVEMIGGLPLMSNNSSRSFHHRTQSSAATLAPIREFDRACALTDFLPRAEAGSI